MNIREFVAKLQTLPDKHKKVILWAIVALLAGAMLLFWFNLAKKRVSSLGDSLKNIETTY